MSLKAELETWVTALEAYDVQDYDGALAVFSSIADSSKILFNMALINATIGKHTAAVELFNAATGLDQYLAIAYFQAGVSNYLLQRFDFALRDFEEALLYLRSNQDINYEQIGLAFRLHAAEVHFNIGLSLLAMGNRRDGLAELADASRAKAVKEHSVIDDCLRDEGRGYTVFSIPVGVIFRPPAAKLKNIKQKDYMGKARLIAASDERDAFTTFTGVTRLKLGQGPTGLPLEGDRAAALRNEGLMVRSTSDPGLPPRSPIRQAMREEVRRGADTGEGTGALAASALTRSKSSAAGVSRGKHGASSSALTAGRQRSVSGANKVRDLDTGGVETIKVDKADQRVTELYDDYYAQVAPEVPPVPPIDSVQAWAAKTRNAPPPPDVSVAYPASGTTTTTVQTPEGSSQSSSAIGPPAPPSSFKGQAPLRRAPSETSAGGPRRLNKGSLRLLQRNGSTRSFGGESEQGRSITFGSSAGYDDDAYDGIDEGYEMTKVRLKIHYENDIRGLSLTPDMTYDLLVRRIANKFQLPGGQQPGGLRIQFQDEDGSLVSMFDEDDFEAAIDVARASAAGRPEGKLEVWIGMSGR